MFGGITHEPAIELCKNLSLWPASRWRKSFMRLWLYLSGSGDQNGAAILEVKVCKVKFARSELAGTRRTWRATAKQRILTVKKGYHGDTFAAMSVRSRGWHAHYVRRCAYETIAVPAPPPPLAKPVTNDDLTAMRSIFKVQITMILPLWS